MTGLADMDAVRWMPQEEIAFVSSDLLARYKESSGKTVSPPIPVDDIIERLLGITLKYDDLRSILGVPDVLGATWIKERRIVIDENLWAEGSQGRRFFTMAHEVGHWCIHRKMLSGLATRKTSVPDIVCRQSGARARGEWQADHFAANLLMPEAYVKMAFGQALSLTPITIYNYRSMAPTSLFMLDPAWEHVGKIAGAVIEEGGFTNVSKTAMRIRLEELGLLINCTPQRSTAKA
ncbi:MAG: ImmA/IrrE family metallo-endopeptidase [Thermodesulfobacteriota bacterium]|nr:ImmA/IrrE family metallo-endopeptidase [Thermodesulfobacteriota bacterium]